MTTLIFIILLLAVMFFASYWGARVAIERKSWRIKLDQESEEVIIEPVKKAEKVEFIEEPDQETLDELAKEPKWRKFLNKFHKAS